MKARKSKPRVVFNASVIFSSFRSSKGASRAIMTLIKQKRVYGIISETILDEALKHASEIPMDKDKLRSEISRFFPKSLPAPEKNIVLQYANLMIDQGDAHLFATCQEARATHLVSLDKHHILVLKGIIPHLRIISPMELLKELRLS